MTEQQRTLLKRASSLIRHIGVFSFVFAKLLLVTSDFDDVSLQLLLPADNAFDDSANAATPLDVTPAAAIDGVMGMPLGIATGAGMAVLPVQLLVVALFSLFVPLPVDMVLSAKNQQLIYIYIYNIYIYIFYIYILIIVIL